MNQSLQQFTKNGKFLMLALDHRGSFKKLIKPHQPEAVKVETIVKYKRQILQSTAGLMSGTLIDVEYGLAAIKGLHVPYLLPLEKTGFIDKGQNGRLNEPDRSANELKSFGAGGAKVLIYFNPDLPTAQQQLEFAKDSLTDSRANDLPLFLEIVAYGRGQDLTIRSVKMFLEYGIRPEVFKLQYPGSTQACRELTALLDDTPWIMLTGGEDFELFAARMQEAADAGCQGFLAGRALWQELFKMSDEEQKHFLVQTLPDRFKQITTCFK